MVLHLSWGKPTLWAEDIRPQNRADLSTPSLAYINLSIDYFPF